MRIGMILLSATGFPPDIRVEKECQALSKAGHEVFVMTVAQTKPDVGSSRYLEDLGATVCNVALMPKSLRVKLLYRLLITNRYWTDAIEKFIVDHKIDVIHAHDLYALPPSVAAAKKLGKPVVADLHENMPAACRAYRDWYPLPKKWLSRAIDNYHWMRWRESQLLKQCAHIIIVVPEASMRLEEYGIDLNKVSVVSNTEDETTFKVNFDAIDGDLLAKYQDRFVISYIGGVGPHRGIETSLRAVKFAKERIPNLLFLVVGVRSPDHLRRIRKEVGHLGIMDHVEILEWVPFEKVNMLNLISQICLVPHNDYEHTQTTIPHKLFQYMLCKKPVLVSDCAPLKRVVGETESGEIFKASVPKDMAAKLVHMHSDDDGLKEQGKRGHSAAVAQYAWTKDAESLVQVYDQLGFSFRVQTALPK